MDTLVRGFASVLITIEAQQNLNRGWLQTVLNTQTNVEKSRETCMEGVGTIVRSSSHGFVRAGFVREVESSSDEEPTQHFGCTQVEACVRQTNDGVCHLFVEGRLVCGRRWRGSSGSSSSRRSSSSNAGSRSAKLIGYDRAVPSRSRLDRGGCALSVLRSLKVLEQWGGL